LKPVGFYISAFLHFYIVATQLVVPSAVTIAVAIDAIICTINFNVSFFVIIINGYRLMFHV
jgi:hypothetical protein